MPVAIKDTVLTRGWPRLLGSRTVDPAQSWDEDAAGSAGPGPVLAARLAALAAAPDATVIGKRCRAAQQG